MVSVIEILRSLVYRLRSEVTTKDLIRLGLTVGENFNRQEKCIIDQSHCWLISIGNNVTMAPRCHILAHDASTSTFLGYTRIGKVIIGDNVFIGAGSVILPGVTIGGNTVIGANSTVSKDLLPNCVYAGNPAKFICSISDFINKNANLMKSAPCYGEEYTLRANISKARKQKMSLELISSRMGFVK